MYELKEIQKNFKCKQQKLTIILKDELRRFERQSNFFFGLTLQSYSVSLELVNVDGVNRMRHDVLSSWVG
ncbi:hypothetical protein T11_4524 [Trichinella zimbabwensis]|uniref:Uncharacterized protein n=1 Tax=Trichinella zimbabwensis TaxID=268475 RepID=A0A0V1HUD2_9BILA|nr:hypothetical protein T11_4524 [Trichinella zimbabwensis]